MSVKFGTSGVRGLVVQLTPDLITEYTQAFLGVCDTGTSLYVGRDLRPSSLRIAQDVITAAGAVGCDVIDCGEVPTPALALAAGQGQGGAVMITGSHIPADRNGMKFYTRQGEITKADERAILSCMQKGRLMSPDATQGRLNSDTGVSSRFAARYIDAFGSGVLTGRRVGLYAHSAVGRDTLSDILSALGAEVVALGRADHFIPVDTEAVDFATRAQIKAWVDAHGLDALVSTDGDSDRPLLADETGQIVPGDVLGQITAEVLGARCVVTPISSNSGVAMKGFHKVITTAIGSPYVIAGMQAELGQVVGYEANGGFLLGFSAQGPAGPMAPLMTRDCMLPLIAVLHAAGKAALSVRVAQEPPVVTLSDRLQEVPQEQSRALMEGFVQDPERRANFLASLGQAEAALDRTDGLRMILKGGGVIHIRPSGNAPELRLYVEAGDRDAVQGLLTQGLTALRDLVQAGA